MITAQPNIECDTYSLRAAWFGVLRAMLGLISVIVGPHDLARMVASLPQGAAALNTCVVLEPTGAPYLKEYWLGLYNSLTNLRCMDLHFVCCSSTLENIPNTPLGLPGRYQGWGLRDLLAHYASDRPGWAGFRHTMHSKKIELPVWRTDPVFTAPTDESQDGYTANTLQSLGALGERVDKGMVRTQLDAMGDVHLRADGREATGTEPVGSTVRVSRADITWPGGHDYVPTNEEGRPLIRPRNRLGDALPTQGGYHAPEAAANAFDGDTVAHVGVGRIPTAVPGESGEPYPKDLIGEKCSAGMSAYFDANDDISVRAHGYEVRARAPRLRSSLELDLASNLAGRPAGW